MHFSPGSVLQEEALQVLIPSLVSFPPGTVLSPDTLLGQALVSTPNPHRLQSWVVGIRDGSMRSLAGSTKIAHPSSSPELMRIKGAQHLLYLLSADVSYPLFMALLPLLSLAEHQQMLYHLGGQLL